MLTRRNLLKGMMLAGGFCLMPFGRRGWALAAPEAVNRHLVVIFMRGAVDGLSIVTPYREPNYYRARSSIALPPPGQADGLVDLDGFFGLHSSLTPLMPWWQNRTLGFIHASGSPSTTRSHFEAQDIMETAMLNSALAGQGWMNGLAQALPDNRSPTRALSFGNVLPKIFQGRYDVSTIPAGISPTAASRWKIRKWSRPSASFTGPARTERALQAGHRRPPERHAGFAAQRRSAKGNDGLGAGRAGSQRFRRGKRQGGRHDPQGSQHPAYVHGCRRLGHACAAGQRERPACQQARRLDEGIAALAQGLGTGLPGYRHPRVSEFGRTVAENGNEGTDHGHGNVAWLMGGGVKGGRVYAAGRGLIRKQLYEGRDLAVTTDFRSIIGAVIAQHFGLDDARIAAIVPDYKRDAGLNGLMT